MDDSLTTPAVRGPRLGRFRRRVLIVVLAIAVVIALLPTILCSTPLRDVFVSQVVPPEIGTVELDRLSVGWLSGIHVDKLVLVDPAGNKFAEAERLTVSKSLLNLAFSRRNLGRIHIDGPKVYVVTRADGSNVEDLQTVVEQIAGASGDSSASTSPQYELEVHDGQLFVADPELGELWQADNVEVQVNHPSVGPLEVAATGRVVPLDPRSGKPLAAAGDLKLSIVAKPSGEQQAELTCENLPLAAARPWCRRFDRALELSGIASGQGSAKWQMAADAPPSISTLMAHSSGRMRVAGFAYSGALVAGRPLVLPQVQVPWNVEVASGRLSATQLELVTDAGTATVTGVLPLSSLPDTAQVLANTRGVVEGRVDLAKLTTLAPELVPLREGAAISSGQVRFRVNAEPDANGQRLLANLETSSLAGTRRGKSFTWDAPLRVQALARQFGPRLLMETANVQSEFATLTLAGDAEQIRAEGAFDLDKLSARLGEFVDLRGTTLSGTGQFNGAMQVDRKQRFTAAGSGTLRNVVVSHAGRELAREASVEWQANCQGKYDAERHLPSALNAGQITLTAGGDELIADLTAATPIADSLAATTWPIKVQLVGGLDNWQRRALPWVALEGWQLAGRAEMVGQGQVRATPFKLVLAESKLATTNFAAQSPEWNIVEPRLEWSGHLELDTTTGTLASRNGQLVGSTFAASLRNWLWSLQQSDAAQVGGELALRADLARLAAWQRVAPDASTRLAAQGELVGNVKLQSASGQLRADLDIRGDKLAVARVPVRGTAPALPAPAAAALKGTVTYRPASDELQVGSLQAQSWLGGMAVQGRVMNVTTAPTAEIAGTIDYDLAALTPLLVEPYLGQGVQLAGRDTAQFRINGPLATAQAVVTPVATSAPVSDLAASITAPWQSAVLYGLPVGGGRLEAQLARGVVDVRPLDFAVAGGKLTAAPKIQLQPAPAVLTLPAGPLLTGVAITPDISNRMLKFVAPVLAGATQSEGKFSIRLDGATVPLEEPRAATATGQLAVERVRVAPGETIKPWLNLAAEVEALTRNLDPTALVSQRSQVTLVSIRDRVVDFRVIDGRVYHQGLEFEVGDATVRSTGSVGFDETLNLMFDIPIKDNWIANRPALAGLRGRALQVPIYGTFARPEMDRRAVAEFTKQLLTDAAGQAIGNEVNRALDRLFNRQ